MMKRIVAAATILLAFATVQASAQSVRTFVSPTGVDTASCSLSAPCRSFAAAYAATSAGGEIAVLGTAGYGTLNISKAISIVNGGGFEAGVAVPSGGIGISIAAGANDAVSLRGLSIDGAGVGETGVQFSSGQSLSIENCIIRHMDANAAGIDFAPSGSSNLLIANTSASDNGNVGIRIKPNGAGTVTAVMSHVEASNNTQIGIAVANYNGAAVNATLADSVVTGSPGVAGVDVEGSAASILTLFHTVSANNRVGGRALNGAIMRIGQSVLTGNTTGVVGAVQSYGDNYIDSNGTTGTLTSVSRQ